MNFKSLTVLVAAVYVASRVCSGKVIPLPPGVRAEGITHAAGTNYLAADITTGNIYLIDIASGLITTAVRAPTPRIGVGLYATNKYIVNAGAGPPRDAPFSGLHVYNIVSGVEAASCPVDDGFFVNDVVADAAYAYYTDSGQPFIYRLSLNSLPSCNVTRIPLPEVFSGGGFRSNGITKFKGGLIVVNSAVGALFFVDLLQKNRVSRITGDATVTNGDGIELVQRGTKYLLYVCQNRLNLISEWITIMTPNRKVFVKKRREFSRPEFVTPTTIAVNGHTAVVANFNFDAPENTTEPFSISTFKV